MLSGICFEQLRDEIFLLKMTTFPSFETYRDLYERFDIVPVYRRLLSDHLTPVSAFRLLDDGTSSAGLFESVVGGEKIGRYSFIAVEPRARVVAYGSSVQYYMDGKLEDPRRRDGRQRRFLFE